MAHISDLAATVAAMRRQLAAAERILAQLQAPTVTAWDLAVTEWYEATTGCAHTQSMDCGACVPPEWFGPRYFSDNPRFNAARLNRALAEKRCVAGRNARRRAEWFGVTS